MPEAPAKFSLTTPIYYVNARPHIGHAYTTLAADVIARRHRLLGDDTYFLTGTDEHGQKIERSALAAGVPPQQFADQVAESFAALWQRMGITHDDFIRTTSERHKLGVQKLFRALEENGAIYKGTYTGQYCVSDEAYVDGPPGIPCPDCGRITETVSETNFYFKLSEYQLPLLNLIESGELSIQPESRRNEVLSFLRGNVAKAVAECDDPLWQSEHPNPTLLTLEDITYLASKGALGQTASGMPFVPGALNDLSISRTSFKWGIPVPGDEDHVIYVWLDALANYMTALGYGSDDESLWQRFWPADLHFVGKEIIRFHCVYWPAFLLAARLPPPRSVVAHGWLLFEESKMSKSKGNIVRTETILDGFGEHVYAKQFPESTKAQQDLFAADVLRYFLLREIPFGKDGSFSFDALIARYNSDLANGYGNLVSRTLAMIQKYFQGTIPGILPHGAMSFGVKHPTGPFRVNHVQNFWSLCEKDFNQWIENYEFSATLTDIWKLLAVADGYLTLEAPWKIGADPSEASQHKLHEILYTAAESIRLITALLYPVLPFATASVWRQLGLGDIERAVSNGELKKLRWGGLQAGRKLGTLTPIFPRADKGLAQIMADMESPTPESPAMESPAPESPAPLDAITAQNDAAHPATGDRPTTSLASDSTHVPAPLEPDDPSSPAAGPRTSTLIESNPGLQVAGSSAETTERVGTPSHFEAQASGIFSGAVPADASPQITIDDFAKVELRVAQILVAERIPKADKLLRLEVDLGFEKRQILSGIAEFYTPEELIGRRIVVITNLAPRKMRGLESHGMLLAASAPEGGKPILATFADSDQLPLGSRLK